MSTALRSVPLAERVMIWERAGRPRLAPATRVPDREIDGMPVLCPSQSPEDGSIPLGHIVSGERLVRSPRRRRLEVTASPPPEASPRIAGECRQEGCAYWADACQLAAVVVHPADSIGRLPTCPIRQRCRWWLEQGPNACGTCDLVAYHVTPGG